MKRIFLLSFAFLLSNFVFSQIVIENPKVGMSTASNVKLEKVELLDNATNLWFHVRYTPGNWISIPDQSFIQPVGSKEKLFIVSADGIPVNEQFTIPESGEVSYKLVFPKIENTVAKLDYGEANEGGTWFFYDIQLKPELFKSIIPEKLGGSWFRSNDAQLEISLFDSVAVYNNQVWRYKDHLEKKGISKISLENGPSLLTIYIKSVNDSICLIGENPKELITCSNKPDKSAIPEDLEAFEPPVFKMDTVVFRGFIRNFSPRFKQRTGTIYVNDVLIGDQISHLIEIEDDGSFEVKFPYSNPQLVFFRGPFPVNTAFIAPGKTTLMIVDNGNPENPVLFAGDCARINTDLSKLSDIRSYDYREMQKKILDFTPEQYKNWCADLLQQDMDKLNKIATEYPISAKARQVMEIKIRQQNISNMMEYQMNSVSAWRQKHNIPRDQRKIDFEPESPDSSYYDFLTNDLVNDPLGVLTSDCYFFFNRLMYLDILRDQESFSLSTADIIDELVKSGYELTPDEQLLADRMKGMDSPEVKELQDEFNEKYGDQAQAFYKKHLEKLQSLFKENKGSVTTPAMMEEYLLAQNVELTAEEQEYLLAAKLLHENPLIQKRTEIQLEIGDLSNKFHADHRDFTNEWFTKKRQDARNQRMQTVLGIKPGLATDLMASQDYCRSIVSQMTPLSDDKLKRVQQEIRTPFVAQYIELMNDNTKAKIAANKLLAGSNINEVPKTKGDDIFDAIISKYKGKVVYVDFWATWCGPCRSGIEQIKPLKDEMEGENVVFVYITNQSSPQKTYENMIPAIKGEHFRVSTDEWNYLSSKFNISGIPHCTLVGKDGRVINPHLAHMQNPQLKTMLMKYIND